MTDFLDLAAKASVATKGHEKDSQIEADPVVWVEEASPKIETKTEGLVPFEPWGFQKEIMRAVAAGDAYVIEKSRQLGVSTAVMVAFAHQLLYRFPRTGIPLHCHVIANKEVIAIERLLKIAKIVLSTADLPDYQQNKLSGVKPETHNAEIRYYTADAHNYIRAHPSSKDAARSFDGNAALLEEVAAMPYAEDVWTSIAPILDDVEHCPIFLVSTYDGDDDLFCDFVDSHEDFGLKQLSLDWRAHPDRDEEWKKRSLKKFAGREDLWRQEHELQRIKTGDLAFDVALVQKWARRYEYVGKRPQVGHRYAKGVDLAGGGRDSTAHVVVDLDANPAQVVYLATYPQQSTPKKIAAIEDLDRQYPGMLYIDATMDNAIASLVEARKKTAIRFTGGSSTITRKFDKVDRLQWMNVPRDILVGWLSADLESGRLVVHPEKFPDLFVGLKTARSGLKMKRRGKHVDELDALLLADIAMSGRRDEGKRRVSPRGLQAGKDLSDLRGRQW